MTYDKALTDLNTTLAYFFGLDSLEINRIDESTLNVKAIISSGETVKTIYKLFQSFIGAVEKANNDPVALNIFKDCLSRLKNDFDKHMDDTRKQIITTFKNFKVNIELSYEGDFKVIYDKVDKLLI